MLTPMVDVIIPVYNRRDMLKRAVRSVQNQTYKNWNLLIVDDGSTDGFVEDIVNDSNRPAKKLASAKPEEGLFHKGTITTAKPEEGLFHKGTITTLRLAHNKGVSYARNQGIQQAQAKWIAFLDSDDEWHAQKLEKQMEYAQQNVQYPLIHCNEIWFHNKRILNQKTKHKKQGGRIFIPCVRLCCISPSAVLIKKKLFEEVGLFREDFLVCEDYELWLRITSRYDVGFLEEPLLIKHGGHEDQLSKKYFAMDYWRIRALYPFLKNKNLVPQECWEVKQEIIKKSQILLRGYKKHQNFVNQKEVQKIYRQVQ